MGYVREAHRDLVIAWLGEMKPHRIVAAAKTGVETWEQMYWKTYFSRSQCAAAWHRLLGVGDTYAMRALVWYQHVHAPGSTDSRPRIVLGAIVREIERRSQRRANRDGGQRAGRFRVGGAFHVLVGDSCRPRCGNGIALHRKLRESPSCEVPGHRRCRAPGCRSQWPAERTS